MRWVLLFTFLFCQISGQVFASSAKVVVYTDSHSILKVLLDISEFVSLQNNASISVSIKNKKTIKKNILDREEGDLIITNDYVFLTELEELGLINFTSVIEGFYDRLVYLNTEDISYNYNIINKKNAIFFKTSLSDKNIFDNSSALIPSILIPTKNLCDNIHANIEIYSDSFEGIIVKESIAKKCGLRFQAVFNKVYDIYYIAVILNRNFKSNKKLLTFLEKSKNVIKIINNDGYHK